MSVLDDIIKWSKILRRDNPRKLYEVGKSKLRMRFNNGQILDYSPMPGPVEGKVLVSYLVEPFLLPEDSWRFYTHQNRWQALEIARIFSRLGYSADIFKYDDRNVGPADYDEYDILFGMGPNYARFARDVPDNVYRIYYATGMHWSQRNAAERNRIERFNERTGDEFSPSRQLQEYDFESIADAIIVVGDESTEESYARHVLDVPLSRVRLSSWEFLESTTDTKDFTEARTKFLYFGGGGLILKGLDLLVEVFSEFTDKELYICGPVVNNTEFMDVYEEELRQSNIHLVGYTRVGSETFTDVTAKCGYVIHPSASESAGGGVITCMHRGLIPILTPEVIRDTGDWGLTLVDSRKETIAATVEEASQYSPEKCRQLSRNATQFAQTNHTKETFSEDFTESLQSILKMRES